MIVNNWPLAATYDPQLIEPFAGAMAFMGPSEGMVPPAGHARAHLLARASIALRGLRCPSPIEVSSVIGLLGVYTNSLIGFGWSGVEKRKRAVGSCGRDSYDSLEG